MNNSAREANCEANCEANRETGAASQPKKQPEQRDTQRDDFTYCSHCGKRGYGLPTIFYSGGDVPIHKSCVGDFREATR